MPYLKLVVNLDKITGNARRVVEVCSSLQINALGVTKGVCGDAPIVKAILAGGLSTLADARISHMVRMREAGIRAPMLLLRSPAPSEIADCLEVADISLNADLRVLRSLSEASIGRGRTHPVLLAVDLDTGREGFTADELPRACTAVANMAGLKLEGLSIYFSDDVEPSFCLETQGELVSLARKIRQEQRLPLSVVSGGSTVVFRSLTLNGRHAPGINQLRIGTAIFLGGTSSRYGFQHSPGFSEDAFVLEAELIEIKKRGKTVVGVLALGKQDTEHKYLYPVSSDVKLVNAWSDHTVVELRGSMQGRCPGDTIAFHPGYYALSRLMISPYVQVEYTR